MTNFYRLHPNYFYGSHQQRYLKIQNSGFSAGALTVCNSRSVTHPTQQATNVNCMKISNNGPFQIDLSNACSDASKIHMCSPIYISVYSPKSSGDDGNSNGFNSGNGFNYNSNIGNNNIGSNSQTQVTCTDPLCPLPNMVMFSIEVNNLGCYSGSKQMVPSSFLFWVVALVFFRFA